MVLNVYSREFITTIRAFCPKILGQHRYIARIE
jgi:hypothetical protein